MVSRNDILPYDHLLGVHKVYSESISNNTIMHILDAQHSGALFQNIAITLMSVLACLFHSYVMHRQKLYSILDFMRSSTTAVGASGSHPGSQSTTKRFEKSVGDILKKHLNGSDSEQLHPSFGLSTGRTQDNVQSPKFHAAHVESASKRERPRVATLSSTTGADNAASEEDIMTSVMWRKHHQKFGTNMNKNIGGESKSSGKISLRDTMDGFSHLHVSAFSCTCDALQKGYKLNVLKK